MKKRVLVIIGTILCSLGLSARAELVADIVEYDKVPFVNMFDKLEGEPISINGVLVYVCDINGQKYIYNTYAQEPRLLPYDTAAEKLGDTDYICVGDYFLSRDCIDDKAFVAYRPVNSLKIYDRNLNLIRDEDFGGGVYVTDMGYFDGQFYCEYSEKYIEEQGEDGVPIEKRVYDGLKANPNNGEKVRTVKVVSNDGITWSKTESELPRTNTISTILPGRSAILNKDMLEIVYESDSNYLYNCSLGDYFVMSDTTKGLGEGNLYFSNDNIYFLTVDLSAKAHELFNSQKTQGISTSLVYDNDIYLRLTNGVYYLKLSSQDVFKYMDKLKYPIYVKYNNKLLGFKTPPVIEDGSTLVPMRFLFEQMGADVDWNGATRTATATLGDTAVTFSIDNTQATVNKAPAKMAVPARLIDDKTMVPLRFLSEELGFKVTWDADTRTAIIE